MSDKSICRGNPAFFSTKEPDISWLSHVQYVKSVERHGEKTEIKGSGPVLMTVAAALASRDIMPPDLRVEQPTLEDVFLALTGRTVGV